MANSAPCVLAVVNLRLSVALRRRRLWRLNIVFLLPSSSLHCVPWPISQKRRRRRRKTGSAYLISIFPSRRREKTCFPARQKTGSMKMFSTKSKCVKSTAVSQDGLGESPSGPFNFHPPPSRGSGEVQQEETTLPSNLVSLAGYVSTGRYRNTFKKTCLCMWGKYRWGRQEGQSLEKRAKEDALLLSISHTHARSPRKHVSPYLKKKQNHFLRIWEAAVRKKNSFFPSSFRATFRLQNFYRAFLFPLRFIPLQKRERKANGAIFIAALKKLLCFSLHGQRETALKDKGWK